MDLKKQIQEGKQTLKQITAQLQPPNTKTMSVENLKGQPSKQQLNNTYNPINHRNKSYIKKQNSIL